MESYTDKQTVPLTGLRHGQYMTVAITGSTDGGNCKLEFRNGSDTNWSRHPGFNGTVTDGILVEQVQCLSASSRIVFDSDPAGHPFWITLTWEDPFS